MYCYILVSLRSFLISMIDANSFYLPEVGSVVGKDEKDRLVACPFFKRVFVAESSFSEGFNRSQNLCSLDGKICGSCGLKLKFKSCFSGVCVVWSCPKLVGLPNGDV